jgi:hypothetical protein
LIVFFVLQQTGFLLVSIIARTRWFGLSDIPFLINVDVSRFPSVILFWVAVSAITSTYVVKPRAFLSLLSRARGELLSHALRADFPSAAAIEQLGQKAIISDMERRIRGVNFRCSIIIVLILSVLLAPVPLVIFAGKLTIIERQRCERTFDAQAGPW